MYIRKLRDLREDNDLSQAKLCESINCKQQAYSLYELGKRDLPYEILIQISIFYNTSTDYILGLTDEKKPYPRKNNKSKKTEY